MRRPLRIVVAGPASGSSAQGGAGWAMMQYTHGLRRLGHDVCLGGPRRPQKFAGYDIVLNVSGLLRPDLIEDVPVRVYLDLDPAFNQLWHAQGICRAFEGHSHFVTVGQAIGRAGCTVPTHGYEWFGTLPPVVLDEWPKVERVGIDAFTTVANLRSYGPIEHEGSHYGQKVHSLRALRDLPLRTGERFVLAMAVHPHDFKDRTSLEEGGWELVDPDEVARTPDAYRSFVQASRAEIGIAKSGYVVSQCGWFSDRSACYLASGRPVLAQETGFSDFLPTGEGLLAFSDIDGAVRGVEEVKRSYLRHAAAARKIAEAHLDSDRVLSTLLQKVCA